MLLWLTQVLISISCLVLCVWICSASPCLGPVATTAIASHAPHAREEEENPAAPFAVHRRSGRCQLQSFRPWMKIEPPRSAVQQE